MVSMFGMTAMAETPDTVSKVKITKNIIADTDVFEPNTTFQFSVVPAEFENGSIEDGGKIIYEGDSEGAYFAGGNDTGTITFNPADVDVPEASHMTGTTELLLDSSVYGAPGIYRYVVSEVPGQYDGMSYSETTYNLDVYVLVDDDGDYYIGGVTFVTEEDDNKHNGIFENTYTTNDLTITKNVTGNQGNKEKDFNFTVKITGSNVGEAYYMVFVDAEGNPVPGKNPVKISGDASAATDFTLKNGQSAKIYGLSANDGYVVEETDADKDGYTTSVDGSESGKITSDTTITYTNNRQVSTPTGVVLNIAPYIAMVALAGVLAFVFLRRRHNNF